MNAIVTSRKVSWTELRVKNRKCFVIKPERTPKTKPIRADTKLRKKKFPTIRPMVCAV